MHYKDIKFQWYNNGIKNISPSGTISLEQFVNAVRNPKQQLKESFQKIEEAAKSGNIELKDKLKTELLFFVTPSAVFNPIRNYESVESFTPFICLEYDKIEYAEQLRDYVFENHKSCIFAFISPSGTGAKFIFLIDVPSSIDDFKSLFYGLAFDLSKFKGFDFSNVRCTQPLFISWDSNARYRDDAIASSLRGYKEDDFKLRDTPLEAKGEGTEEEIKECFRVVGILIDRIEDNGHNTVIKASTLAAGLCSNYGIDTEEMLAFLEDKIRNNSYLSKGTNGYLKTMKTMFNRGFGFPTSLRKNN